MLNKPDPRTPTQAVTPQSGLRVVRYPSELGLVISDTHLWHMSPGFDRNKSLQNVYDIQIWPHKNNNGGWH